FSKEEVAEVARPVWYSPAPFSQKSGDPPCPERRDRPQKSQGAVGLERPPAARRAPNRPPRPARGVPIRTAVPSRTAVPRPRRHGGARPPRQRSARGQQAPRR